MFPLPKNMLGVLRFLFMNWKTEHLLAKNKVFFEGAPPVNG